MNLGSGAEIVIRELVELVARLTVVGEDIVWDTSKPEGQPWRCLDTSKAERLLGVRAKTPFEEGLRKTVHWYQQTLEALPAGVAR